VGDNFFQLAGEAYGERGSLSHQPQEGNQVPDCKAQPGGIGEGAVFSLNGASKM
jgi:hypothetical protein